MLPSSYVMSLLHHGDLSHSLDQYVACAQNFIDSAVLQQLHLQAYLSTLHVILKADDLS